jgi:NADH-quinone oxidoreductase subunit L
MPFYNYLIWIPLLPLISFLLLGLFGKKYLSAAAGWLGTIAIAAATVLSLIAAWQYFLVDGKQNGVYVAQEAFHYTWLQFREGVSIDMGIIVDPISVMMLVVVTFVSLMVHLFSIGYMKGEERFATYYAYLGLFTFSMLGLVMSANLFQIYMFWELVGVSSFLLIGFYFEKPSAVAASKKAFIVTRFADLGFLIGILILAFSGGSLDITTLIQRLSNPQSPEFVAMAASGFLGISLLSWGLILVFIGGAGKSAMLPLHIWLPDAMEGPTPVSALIHAATMVVAGVYLVARLFPVFHMDAAVMELITGVGVSSALFAAVIACTQTDIKRVLAYSTMSQIGYMMFALGVSGTTGESGLGFMASMFHLFTHAFFKSLLFLCAGAVIHLVHSNEMKDMGGLRKYMPITHIGFLIACLAISGIPPFAGFFSKEEILTAAWHHNKLVYGFALFTAALTSFYMFRLYFSIFWRKETELHHHHGEGTITMKIPLLILSVCAVAAGWIPFAKGVTADGQSLETHLDILFSALPVGLSVLAILLAAAMYRKASDAPEKMAGRIGLLYTIASRKFFVDEVYIFITKKIIFPLIGRPAAWIDRNIVDGAMNASATATARFSSAIKNWQSGRVQQYTLAFFGGVAVLAVLFIYLFKS